jgi:hypothetical protein
VNAAVGFKAHTGWAVAVVVGRERGEPKVLERARVELVEKDTPWAKQPYHAAEHLRPDAAKDLVKRSIDVARRSAVKAVRDLVERNAAAGRAVRICAVVVGEAMPDWDVAEILAVHFRMHKAEGVLFRDVLVRAGRACDLRVAELAAKSLHERAGAALVKKLAALGKGLGPPWGQDQKDAALAAMIALRVF